MTYSQEPGLQPALSVCVAGFIYVPLCLLGLTVPSLSAEPEAEDKECFKQIKREANLEAKP